MGMWNVFSDSLRTDKFAWTARWCRHGYLSIKSTDCVWNVILHCRITGRLLTFDIFVATFNSFLDYCIFNSMGPSILTS